MKPIGSRHSSVNSSENECEINIDGLTKDEYEAVQAMLLGAKWVRVKNGRLETVNGYAQLPEPEEDPKRPEPWQNHPRSTKQADLEFSYDEEIFYDLRGRGPSFTIQHLCGYNYSRGGYIREAKALKSYGFYCCRSNRGNDGQYWEVFYLPGLWCAKGDLLKAITSDGKENFRRDEEEAMNKAVSFLCKHRQFGSLDVSGQRAAMTID